MWNKVGLNIAANRFWRKSSEQFLWALELLFLDICLVDIHAYVLQFLSTDEFIQLCQHPCWSDLILVSHNLLENRNFSFECT